MMPTIVVLTRDYN